MEFSKKVSIITPVIKNDAIFLTNYLNSLSNQVYENIELIVLHEKDEEISNVLKGFDEFDIKAIEIEDNTLVGVSRNEGIKHATGDYVYFLDVDDFLHEHTIYCLVQTAQVHNSEVVIGKVKTSTTRPVSGEAYKFILNRCLKNRLNKKVEADGKTLRLKCNNILISKDLITRNEISFSEKLNYNSDLEFIFSVYDKSELVLFDEDAIYIKMHRNDTVRYPSLKAREAQQALKEYPMAYKMAVRKISGEKENIRKKLDKTLIARYNKFSEQIYAIEDKRERAQTLELWAHAMNMMEIPLPSKKVLFVKTFRTNEISKLKNRKFRASKHLNKTRTRVIKAKKLALGSRSAKGKLFYKEFLSKLPVKDNYILFESFLGKNMSDSPKYIYKYLSEKYPGKFKFIWVFNETKSDLPDDIIQVKRFSLQHLYYVSVSKFWVNNMRQPLWFIKKKDQVFLSTWHGTPLKKLVFDMDEVHSANKNYKQDFYNQSRDWDYLISANEYSTNVFKSAFLFDNPILELGYPRNDLLHAENKDEIALRLKEKLGIPTDKKIVLYAPTWRDDEYYKPGKYKFKLQLDLERLKKELGDEYFFVLRTHYFIADHLDITGAEDFVYNASKYDDITELYLLSDVLITDYSSVFFDYANLKRPMMFFTYDLEKYRGTLRGFYLNMEEECPGPLVLDNDELISRLKDYDKLVADYKDKIDAFYDRFCYLEDGKASERIAEEVIIKNM